MRLHFRQKINDRRKRAEKFSVSPGLHLYKHISYSMVILVVPSLSLTLRLQWYNPSAAMRVVTPRVCSHARLMRPKNKCVKPPSIEWDKFDNTHLSHLCRPWINIHMLQAC